jgi:CFEM domain-containing protein
MKTSLLALAGLASLAAAQNARPTGTLLDAVPECAHKCLTDAINNGTPCSVDDGDCLCIPDNYYAIYDVGNTCVLLECGGAVSVGASPPFSLRLPSRANNPPEEVLPQAQQYCADITGGSAEVTGTELVTALPSTTSSPAASQSSGSAASENTSAASADAESTTTGAAPAATTSDEPDAAVSLPRLGGLGLLAIGALAAF